MTDIKDAIQKGIQSIGEAAKLRRKLEAFRVVYEKADRILSGTPVRIAMVLDPPYELETAPGWTDGETISLNARVINNDLGNLPMSGIVLHTKAVNYHELCHVLYTPRFSDDICVWVRAEMGKSNPYAAIPQNAVTEPSDAFLWYAFNALEDQRIEMLFSGKYRPAIPYFEAIALKWLVNNAALAAESFPLIYGRRFLAANVRSSAERAFVAKYGNDLATRFKECIDAYLGVVYPGGTMKAKMYLRRYAKCMAEMQNVTATHLMDVIMTADNGGGEVPKAGDPSTIKVGRGRAKDQKEASENMEDVKPRAERSKPKEEASDDDETDAVDDGTDDTEDDDGDASDGAPETTSESKSGTAKPDSTEDAGNGDTGANEGDSEGQSEDSTPNEETGDGGGGSGLGHADEGNPAREAQDAFYQALEELFEDEDFLKELNDTAQAVQSVLDGDAGVMAVGEDLSGSTTAVPTEAVQAANATAQILSRLRTELEEQHFNRQASGGLDAKRFLTRQPWETDFFKTYEPGSYEEAAMECVITVDLSGSMQYQMGEVSTALWIVKRALEVIDARITVLGYSDFGYVMYQPEERVEPTKMKLFKSFSGTSPDSTLQEAYRLLHGSTRNMKLLLNLTDGAWQGSRIKQDAIMAALNEEGVTTVLMYLGNNYGGGDDHGCGIYSNIHDAKAVAAMAVRVVDEGLRNMIGAIEHV